VTGEALEEELRGAEAASLARLERLPFPRALTGGAAPSPCLGSFLRAIGAIADELEAPARELRGAGDDLDPAARMASLRRDLDELGLSPFDVDPPALRALVVAISLRELPGPARLGAAYALGIVGLLGPTLAGGGRSFLASCGADRAGSLERLARGVGEDRRRREEALAGARLVLDGIEGVAALVGSAAAAMSTLATTLNREAGQLILPDDLREVRAAIAAGLETRRRFPYLEARYGERGRRFSHSDSAWLARQTEARKWDRILWLGRVLSARGLPRLVLEEHLLALEAHLTAALPPAAERHRALATWAARLGAQREAAIASERLAALESDFDARVGEERAARFPRTGALLAAAMADEACGIENALPSLVGWMADRGRFDDEWVRAVEATVKQARRAVRRGIVGIGVCGR
jgi:hypothetical protein